MQDQPVEKQQRQKTQFGKVEQPVRQSGSETFRKVEIVSNLSDFFDTMSVHWQGVLLDAEELGKATLEALPDDYAKEQLPEFQARQDKLNKAVEMLQSRLDYPELVLAMTGTTSSGKSTVANLLVGDDIMPSEVQEMSAGVVKIVHSDNEQA